MMRALVINDQDIFRDELAAFRVAFRGRRFRILITRGIIAEYQNDVKETFPIQLQPALDNQLRSGRAIYLEDSQLPLPQVATIDLPKEHESFVLDAIAGKASYLVTSRRRWLGLSDRLEENHGLRVVTPGRFVELEG
jgi:predicted nucleic acid-binding protein